jgi:5-hydroxyisourate hydrolase
MTMAKLSTHVLDIAQGKPAAGVKVALFSVTEQGKALIKMEVTNLEGRCSAALLEGDAMQAGLYELVFSAGDYFAAQGMALPTPRFIDLVTLAFGIADPDQNYHVPLVVSPWSYSTYRGS